MTKLDCQSCGACCYGPEEYVAVTGVDLVRLGPRDQSRYVVRRGDRAFMKMVSGHCAALHARQGHFSCRVYGGRPNVCHVVEAGSRECLDARRRHGFDDAR
jgi:Fe-S-cluster containining protein